MTREELEQLTDSFSDSEIAQMKNITRGMVGNWRKKYGIKSYTSKTGCVKKNGVPTATKKDYSSYGRPSRTEGYVTFFDEIDTPAKAYFLGFIASDGNIDYRGRYIRIQIHHQDREILEVFLNESGWKSQISDINPTSSVKRDPQVLLCLSSVHACSALAEWGIASAKSLTLKLLKPVPSELQPHFIRGVWDGDGYITHRQFGLTSGSLDFANQINDMICHQTGFKLNIRQKPEGYYALDGCKSNGDIIRWIYSNPYPALSRKAIQVSRYWSI